MLHETEQSHDNHRTVSHAGDAWLMLGEMRNFVLGCRKDSVTIE